MSTMFWMLLAGGCAIALLGAWIAGMSPVALFKAGLAKIKQWFNGD